MVTGAVRWLEKGVPWDAEDAEGCFAEGVTRMYGNKEAREPGMGGTKR